MTLQDPVSPNSELVIVQILQMGEKWSCQRRKPQRQPEKTSREGVSQRFKSKTYESDCLGSAPAPPPKAMSTQGTVDVHRCESHSTL